jgi:hypothetical protein
MALSAPNSICSVKSGLHYMVALEAQTTNATFVAFPCILVLVNRSLVVGLDLIRFLVDFLIEPDIAVDRGLIVL